MTVLFGLEEEDGRGPDAPVGERGGGRGRDAAAGAPLIGGIGVSFLLELLVDPAVHLLAKRRGLPPGPAQPG